MCVNFGQAITNGTKRVGPKLTSPAIWHLIALYSLLNSTYVESMSVCGDCPIRNHAICAALDDSELAILRRIGRVKIIPAGQTLMWEGDEATIVANVVEGVLKLSTSLGDGREQIVGVAYPADFIGRPFGERVPYTVTAITDVRLRAFQRAGFEEFAQEHPKLEHKMLQRTLGELDRAREWMLLLGRKTAQEKLATFLLYMPDRLSETVCEAPDVPVDEFVLPFGRQQMADLLGLTIETVSRQLGELIKAGLITLKNQREVTIVDRERLEELAG